MTRTIRLIVPLLSSALLLPAQLPAQTAHIATTIAVAANSTIDIIAPRYVEARVAEALSIRVLALDANAVAPSLSVQGLPRTANFDDNGDGTRTLNWTPQAGDLGEHLLQFTAMSAGDSGAVSSQKLTIEVTGTVPRIHVPDVPAVLSGETLSFRVAVTKPSGVVPELIGDSLPETARFLDNGDGSRQFVWTPGDSDLGTRDVVFRAVDPVTSLTSSVTVTIQITSASLTLVDAATLDGTRGFALTGTARSFGELGQSVAAAGDVNDDGLDDAIVGDPGAARADCSTCLALGEAYVLFGSAQGFPAELNVAELDGANGFSISGGQQQLGEAVSGAGDINADGIADVAIGEPFSLENSSGRVHVVFGYATPDGEARPARIDVNDLDGSNGFTLEGLAPGDVLGWYLDAAGDVNGDGIDDLIIGTPQNFFGPPAPGRAYVVFGRSSGFPARWSLQDLDGLNGFEIVGSRLNERAGTAVSGVGDVNADGVDDVLVSRGGANLDGTEDTALRAFVLFGRQASVAGDFPASVYLSEIGPQTGFAIGAANVEPYQAGSLSVSGGVDINADGIADLVLGDSLTDPDGVRYAGQVYVVFGRNTASTGDFPFVIDVTRLDGTNGLVLVGDRALQRLGISVSGAGDVNADGVDDLVAKAFRGDRSFVVFGRDTVAGSSFPASLSVSELGGSVGFVILNTSDTNSNVFSRRVSAAGDLNGDDIDDILIGSPDALVNGTDTGKVTVIYGARGDD